MQLALSVWLEYIEEYCGFVLPKTQHQWLANAIKTVALEHGMTVEELYQAVHASKQLERTLIDNIVIKESRFFRDTDALLYIKNVYQRHLDEQWTKPFSVLSVGCSTGQEVWSVAMVLDNAKLAHRTLTQKTPTDYQLLGVDISQMSLAYAELAHYPLRTKQEIPSLYHHHLMPIEGGVVGWQPAPQLRERVAFMRCNIFDTVSFAGVIERVQYQRPTVIICQNTLIYFRRFDQRDILDRLVSVLEEGGYLVLGLSEAWFWQHPQMERLADTSVNVWKKLPQKP